MFKKFSLISSFCGYFLPFTYLCFIVNTSWASRNLKYSTFGALELEKFRFHILVLWIRELSTGKVYAKILNSEKLKPEIPAHNHFRQRILSIYFLSRQLPYLKGWDCCFYASEIWIQHFLSMVSWFL